MMLEEHIQHTIALQQEGRIDEALDRCKELTANNSGDFRLHFLLAMLYQQQHNIAAAIRHYQTATQLNPDLPSAFYNLGVLYFSQDNFLQAAESYQEAALLSPDDPDIFFNLALSLKNAGQWEEAQKKYEQVLSLTPTDPDTHYNLGVLFRESGQEGEAIESFEKTIICDPQYLAAHNNLGYLYHKTGQPQKALAAYRKVVELDPDHHSARHMIAALSGTTTNSSPLAYVKDLFDQFSDNFDEALQDKLAYNTPNQLRKVLDEIEPETRFSRGLDMGCGTGLSGVTFADRVGTFIGMDLSPGMLAKAAEKKIYCELHENDIVNFLQNSSELFDLFIAADVFVYLGDLKEIFQLIKKRAASDACFLFSTEKCASHFTLQPSGRYAHSENYIKEIADSCGFSTQLCQAANLRKEKKEWIEGLLFLLHIP